MLTPVGCFSLREGVVMKISFKIFRRAGSRIATEHGVSSVEYATLLCLIAIAIVPVISGLSSSAAGSFERVNAALGRTALYRTVELPPGTTGSGAQPTAPTGQGLSDYASGGGTLDLTPDPTMPTTSESCVDGLHCQAVVTPNHVDAPGRPK